MTNGDYIRQMDDEMLAKFFQYMESCCVEMHPIKDFYEDVRLYPEAYSSGRLEDISEWVKEEVKL